MEFSFASKSFAGECILESCMLTCRDGRVSALLGPTGVGKTTLARMIAGLEADDSGQQIQSFKTGFVFQEPRLMPWLTVLQNIELVAPEKGWLAKLGLATSRNLYPRQLSLGMARRVALARAFASKPQLLILDEPFSSLDGETASAVKAVLQTLLIDTKVTALLITHDAADVKLFEADTYYLSGRPAKLT